MLYFACHAGQVTFFKCSVSGPGAYFNFFLPCRPGHFLFDCLVSGTGNFFLIYLVSGLGINEPGFLFWLNPKVLRAYACVRPCIHTCVRIHTHVRLHVHMHFFMRRCAYACIWKCVPIRTHDCACCACRFFLKEENEVKKVFPCATAKLNYSLHKVL